MKNDCLSFLRFVVLPPPATEMKRWPVWVAVFVLPWLWASAAFAQSIPYSHDFEATDTPFHLYPMADPLAWKTNPGGGAAGVAHQPKGQTNGWIEVIK